MAKNQMMDSTTMTLAERKKIAEEQKKRQQKRTGQNNARVNASEFADSPTASPYQKQVNKARNEGRYANIGFKKGDADPKGLFKPKKKTTTTSPRAKNTDAKDPRGNQIKATPGAANKTEAAKTWKDYSSIAAAKAGGALYYSKNGVKQAAVYASDLNGMSLREYMNKKTGKTPRKTTSQTSSKKSAGVSTYDEVKDQKGRKNTTAKTTKSDNKSYYGSLSKAKTGGSKLPPIPAGAKKFTTDMKFNNKTHTLRKIENRPGMYLVPRKKAK